MAEKISVEIGLEGGDAVEQGLEGILETGKKTFSELQSSADQLDFSSVSDQFQTVATTIKDVQNVVKSAAGFEQIIQGIKNVEGAFEALGTAVTKMATRMTRSLGILGVFARSFGPIGIAAGVAAGAIIKFGDEAADALNKLTASGAKLDLTAQSFDKLQRALTQAGVSSDSVLPGLQKLKESLAGEFFQVDVIKGLQNFIVQLERIPDGVERTKLAMDKLGDALGAEVIAGLQTGTINSKNFATALASITPATQEQIVQAAKYQQTLNQLSAEWTKFKEEVATPIAIPLFGLLKQELEEIRQGIATTKREWDALASVLTKITPKVGVDISLTGSLQSQLDAAKAKLDQIGQAGQQAGQQAAQGLQLVANPLTGMPEAINKTNQALQQTGQAAQQAGQQFQIVPNPFTGMPEAINTTKQALQQVGSTGAQALQQVNTTAQTTSTTLSTVASTLAGWNWDPIAAGIRVWNDITTAIQSAIDKLLRFIGLKPSAPATGGGAPGKARGGLLGGSGTGTSDSNLAWVSRGEYIMPAGAVRQPGVLSLLEGLRRSGRIPGFAEGGLAGSFDMAASNMNAIIASMLDVATALRQAQSLFHAEARLLMGNARGGLLGGRGTGTSDSNLAWVSRGEYITPARAVAQPGVLAFLEALRRSGGNLSRVLDGMGRFALGGMVPRMPAFAAGGAVGNMSHVTIAFPGLPEISGLRASSGVVDQLHRAAALAQVRSGGRKPSRYS